MTASRPRFRGVLSRIVVHPVKSLDGVDVAEARVLPSGALEHDRRFAIRDAGGRVVNGKRDLRVHDLEVRFDAPSRILHLGRRGESLTAYPLDGGRSALHERLSAHFEMPVTLEENGGGGFPDDVGSPGPTLVSAATLEEVSRWFPGISAAGMARRFRANLIVDGFPPFGEDALVAAGGEAAGGGRSDRAAAGDGAGVRFRVGGVAFVGTNPCARCGVPTRDPSTGSGYPSFAKAFSERRREQLPAWAPRERFDHFYRLAVNTRPATGEGGIVRVGDAVEIEE